MSWEEQALCREVDPDLFFPPKSGAAPEMVRQALRICRHCPVKQECLDLAMNIQHEAYDGLSSLPGIWGGTRRIDRVRLRKQESK